MYRGINAETPSATTSFSSINNVGRNVTTLALTHSPTKTSQLPILSSDLDGVIISETSNDIDWQDVLSRAHLPTRIQMISKPIQESLERVPVIGEILEMPCKPWSLQFLSILEHKHIGEDFLIGLDGIGSLTTLIHIWWKIGMAYKHLKISVAAFERSDGSSNLLIKPPFWETIEGSAEYYFLVCPLQDLISCSKGTEANPTVTEFKRIWTTMTKARTSALVPSFFKCGLYEDGLPCLEPRLLGDTKQVDLVTAEHEFIQHKKLPIHLETIEENTFGCGLFACPFSKSQLQDPHSLQAHISQHLKAMGIFEEYAAETSFPLDNACSNGNSEDELHWGANLAEFPGSEFVCRAANCFLQMRVHQTQNGLDLHMRLLHRSEWDKRLETTRNPVPAIDVISGPSKTPSLPPERHFPQLSSDSEIPLPVHKDQKVTVLRGARETKHPRIILHAKSRQKDKARKILKAEDGIVEDESSTIMTRAKTKRRNNIQTKRPPEISKKYGDDEFVPDSDPMTFLSSPSAQLGPPKASERE
jgi:hypothetical protein